MEANFIAEIYVCVKKANFTQNTPVNCYVFANFALLF